MRIIIVMILVVIINQRRDQQQHRATTKPTSVVVVCGDKRTSSLRPDFLPTKELLMGKRGQTRPDQEAYISYITEQMTVNKQPRF